MHRGLRRGGQISRSFLVENFPGSPTHSSGADLATRIREQALGFGARIVMDDVASVDLGQRPFLVSTSDTTYAADAVVVATGSSPRTSAWPARRTSSATGSPTARSAMRSSPGCAGRRRGRQRRTRRGYRCGASRPRSPWSDRESFRADAADRGRGLGRRNRMLTLYVVEELVAGDEGLVGVRLRDVAGRHRQLPRRRGAVHRDRPHPGDDPFTPWLEVDAHGCIVTTPGSTATNVPGVFAAGTSRTTGRQAVTAAAAGCMLCGHRRRAVARHRRVTGTSSAGSSSASGLAGARG